MTHEYRVSSNLFDLRTVVTCGQVFRWEEPTPGMIQGVDGDHWFLAVESEGDWAITSNASQEQFNTFSGLDTDDGAVRAAIGEALPELRELVGLHTNLRLLRPSCWVEASFSFLCSSNNHIKRIGHMVNHLASYGPPLTSSPFQTTRFPGIGALAMLEEGQLREAKFGYRAKTIPAVAKSLSLQSRPPSGVELETWLASMEGIGPKLAACIAIYAFHDGRAVPLDVHMKRAFVHFGLAQSMSDPDLREGVKRFKDALQENAAYAQLLMFHDQRMRTLR